MILPIWARKPNHKKEVVATNRGWVVKDTGEILSRYRDLDQKLAALAEEIKTVDTTSVFVEPTPEPVQDEIPDQLDQEPDETVELNKTEEQPKRRGRPKKNAHTNQTD